MYAFTRKPRWIAAHLLFAVLLTTFVLAGFWQLSRHQSRKDLNSTITSRQDIAVVPIGPLLENLDPSQAEYRIVSATGRFFGPAVIVRSRSLNGQPGCHVLSTLAVEGEPALVVNRGWLPLDICEGSAADSTDPPETNTELTGRVRQTQTRGQFGAVDPPDGVLDVMARVDLDRLQKQVDVPLYPVYVEQITPADPDLPVELAAPETDGGPHLGYAVQWFAFALVSIIGYPLVLRKQAREVGPVGER